MSEYTLIVDIPNACNRQIRISVNLTGSSIDYPNDYFRKQENRTKLRNDIENQSQRQVCDSDLNFFIKEWCLDIKQGLSPTTVSRDLPPLGIATFTPNNSGYRIAKQPNQQISLGITSDNQSQSSNTSNNRQKKEEAPETETWSTSNDADF